MSAALASSRNPLVTPTTSQSSDVSLAKGKCLVPQKCGFDPAKLAPFLRAKAPHDSVKTLARLLNASPRTVENWLAGTACPGFGALGAMVALWGPEFLVAVMCRPPEWASEALAREELAELERRSAALKAKLREGSAHAGPSGEKP